METISSHQWNFISRESKNLWLHVELPRAERFKWENIIVIGIVPSLNREPKDLNQFLEPAIDELKAMWKGVRLCSCLSRFTLTFRVAVISISSDIPATRKICGFQGHSAYLGSPRCLKTFPGGFRKKKQNTILDLKGIHGPLISIKITAARPLQCLDPKRKPSAI